MNTDPSARIFLTSRFNRLAASAVTVSLALGISACNPNSEPQPSAPKATTVAHGDTLSGIAFDVCPDSSDAQIQEEVLTLISANDLPSSNIHAGQILKIPDSLCSDPVKE